MERRKDVTSVASLEREPLRVGGDIQGAEACAEDEQRRSEPAETGRERREDERHAHADESHDRDQSTPDPLTQPAGKRHRQQRAERHREQRKPELGARQVGLTLHRRDARGPRADQEAVGEEAQRDRDARAPHHATTTSIPAARNSSSCSSFAGCSVTRWVSSSSGAITYGPAEPSLSAADTATTSAAFAIIARFTYDSSRSSTVIPISGWRLQTPRTSTSARTPRSASTVAAPTSACASFTSTPPRTETQTAGWSASATAIGGLFVITVASRSRGNCRATSSVVVPESSTITWPSRNRRLVARAIAALASGACASRASYGRSPTAAGSAPP